MKIRYYIITAILALSFFLIINAPAAPILKALKDKIPQVKIENVSGTLWQGSAQQITVLKKYSLQNVSWSSCMSYLLTGKACVEFSALYNKNPISGLLSVGLGMAVQGEDIKASISAKELGQMVTLPMGEIDGDIVVELATVNWVPDGIPSATGLLKWNNASVTVDETAKLGDISISLNDSNENHVSAEISNKGGDLSISGNATLAENTDYNLDLLFKPQDSASKMLTGTLSLFTQPQTNGSFTLENNGNLKKLGFI